MHGVHENSRASLFFPEYFSLVSGHVGESLALRLFFSSYPISSQAVVPSLMHSSCPISHLILYLATDSPATLE